MKNDPRKIITKKRKNVKRKKFGPRKLKKYSIAIPIMVIIIPPVNSHFQAT